MKNVENVKNVEITEVTTTVVTENSTKKSSLRQDFLKAFTKIQENKDTVCKSIEMDTTEFDKMCEYFDTQINKSKTVKKGKYVPTDKAHTILDILLAYEGIYKTGKEIAENSNGLLKANGVSGSIRGLVTNELVEATNESPKKYIITQKGIDLLNTEEQ